MLILLSTFAHTDPLFRDSKFLKFVDIYSLHLGKFMYSYNNNLLPPAFTNFLLRTNQVHSHNTRGSNQAENRGSGYEKIA